jgi:hypothetical protein
MKIMIRKLETGGCKMKNRGWNTWRHLFYVVFSPSLLETPSHGAYNPATNDNLTQNKMANLCGRKYIDRSM